MTDYEDKLFAGVDAYYDALMMIETGDNERESSRAARAKLLEAVDAYSANVAARCAGLSDALTHAEQQLAVYDKLIPDVARWQLMQAKAAVCDAYIAYREHGRRLDRDRLTEAEVALFELEAKP